MFFDLFLDMFFTYYIRYLKYIFYVKIKLFVTLKPDQDPDPHGSTLVWLTGSRSGSGSALRVKSWIRTRIETNAAPQHWRE
jgi:hypothetical protein